MKVEIPDKIGRRKVRLIGKPLGVGNLDTDYKDFDADIWFGAVGAPSCGFIVTQAGVQQFTFQQKLDPFAVKINKALIDSNFQLFGSATHEPSDFFCPERDVADAGSEVDMYVGVSPDGNITENEIKRQTQIMGGPWKATDADMINAYEADLTNFVTQPKDPLYTGIIHVTFWWADSTYWWRDPNTLDTYQLRFKQIDVEDQL